LGQRDSGAKQNKAGRPYDRQSNRKPKNVVARVTRLHGAQGRKARFQERSETKAPFEPKAKNRGARQQDGKEEGNSASHC
jgi:hypothetical protein